MRRDNKAVRNIAEVLIATYFVLDGLSRLYSTSRDLEVQYLNEKSQQLQKWLINDALSNFVLSVGDDSWLNFMWLKPVFPYLLAVTGVVEIATCLMFYWTEAGNLQSRMYYVRILTIILAFDALFLHFPWSELPRGFGKEFCHFSYDIALIGGLFMLVGFRDDSAPSCSRSSSRSH